MADEAGRGLILHGADGSGLERLSFSEDHFRIGVRFCLVFPGEIQVDIWLFIPVKAHKGFKRNVIAILHERFPTDRADPIRHIPAGHTFVRTYIFGSKITVSAAWAAVMRL